MKWFLTMVKKYTPFVEARLWFGNDKPRWSSVQLTMREFHRCLNPTGKETEWGWVYQAVLVIPLPWKLRSREVKSNG